MKKILVYLLAAAMLISAIGCTAPAPAPAPAPTQAPAAPSEAPATPETPAATQAPAVDYSKFKIALLLPGTINDNGWNAAGYRAVEALKANYGVETAYTENIAASDIEEFLRGYATQGYQIIICHGSQYIDYIHKVAPEFPETKYLISYGDADKSQPPNVACVGPIESGFLTGATAAAISKTGVVAMLGGEENPSIKATIDEFEQGAKFVNPDAKVFTGYIGTLTDADKGKEMAKTFIAENKIDVISASANAAGLGVIHAAQEAGIHYVGFNSDQNNAAPETVVVSVLRNFDHMYNEVFKMIAEGTFEGKLYAFGIAQEGMILSDWHGFDQKMPEVKATMDKLFKDFKDGTVKVGQ